MIRDTSRVDSLAAVLRKAGVESTLGFYQGKWRATCREIGTSKSTTCYSEEGLADALARALADIVLPKGRD